MRGPTSSASCAASSSRTPACAPLAPAASSSRRRAALQRQISTEQVAQRVAFGDEPRPAAVEARRELGSRANGRIELERLLRARAQQIVDERSAVADAVIVQHQRAGRPASARGSAPLAAAAPSAIDAARRRDAERRHAAPGGSSRRSTRPATSTRQGYSVKSRGRCATMTESGRSPKSQRARFERLKPRGRGRCFDRSTAPRHGTELALQRFEIAARREHSAVGVDDGDPQLQILRQRALVERRGRNVRPCARHEVPRPARSTTPAVPPARQRRRARPSRCRATVRALAAALSAAHAGTRRTLSRSQAGTSHSSSTGADRAEQRARHRHRDAVGVVARLEDVAAAAAAARRASSSLE